MIRSFNANLPSTHLSSASSYVPFNYVQFFFSLLSVSQQKIPTSILIRASPFLPDVPVTSTVLYFLNKSFRSTDPPPPLHLHHSPLHGVQVFYGRAADMKGLESKIVNERSPLPRHQILTTKLRSYLGMKVLTTQTRSVFFKTDSTQTKLGPNGGVVLLKSTFNVPSTCFFWASDIISCWAQVHTSKDTTSGVIFLTLCPHFVSLFINKIY